MSTFSNNNVDYLVVGGTAAKTAEGGLLTEANLGEICVLSTDGTIMSEADAATETKFKVGVRRGPNIDFVSDVIDKNKINYIGRKDYSAAVQQVTYVGSNGTSGAINAADNELYYLRLYLEDYLVSSSDGKRVKHGVYRSGNSTNQALIAKGVAKSLIENFSREASRQIKIETVTSVAGAPNTGAGSATVTYGSKHVTFGTAVDAVAAVGDYVRLGTGATSGVYKIVAMDTTNEVATLDTPYQGEDASIAVGDQTVITATAANSGDWGIKLTGVPAEFTLGKFRYKVVRFEAQVDTTEGFTDNTPITTPTSAKAGTGVTSIVKEMEWFYQGNEGEFYRMGEPNIFERKTDVTDNVAGGGYALIDILFVDDSVVGFQPNVSKKHLVLAIPANTPTYALTGTADDITDVLEVLAWGTANGNLALT